MPVTNVHKDPTARTMTVTAEFAAPVERVWRIWKDPRQLEKWWGPPTFPATFEKYDLTPGSLVSYYMTGPSGERPRGWWKIRSVEAPRRLEFEDGFSDDEGKPNPAMPTAVMRVALDDKPGGGTRMTVVTSFPSVEAMEQMLAMGMEEGLHAAMDQIDALLGG